MGSVSEGSISFSNMDVQSTSGEFSNDREWRRLKFEAGKSYRIKFIDSNVEMRRRHYQPLENGKQGYYRCLSHLGYCPVCQAASDGFGGEGKNKLKKAQEMFGANVLVYNTDAQGNPVQPLNAEVYFWNFNAKKFVAIRTIMTDPGWQSIIQGDITKIDFVLTCADAQAAQFQNITITPSPTCLYSSDPTFKAACDAKIEKDKYPLAKMLCKEVDLPTMISVFGLPQKYLPADVMAQMPAGQTTVSDMVNGTQPVQGTPVPQPVPAPQPVQQAPADVPFAASQPVQQFVPPTQPVMEAAPAQPIPAAPIPQAAPVQAPADAYAGLDELANMLN